MTTPFSFVATTSSLVWEGITPIFSDIKPDSLTLDPEKVSKNIRSDTSAILGVHVYGNPCDIEGLLKVSHEHNIPLIFDAAHCFGVKYKGESLLNF